MITIEHHEITLHGRVIPYRLRRSKRRSVGLMIDHSGLTVAAPARISTQEITASLQGKASWVLAKLDKWEDVAPPETRRMESGTRLPLLGRDLELQIVAHPTRARTKVEGTEARLTVEIDRHLHGEMKANTIRKGLERWYRRQAEIDFPPRVENYAKQLGHHPSKIVIRSQKRRWGSCDSKGIIRLNWRLIGASPELIDYVCAHEVAHLVEANHSPAFWAVVEKMMPDWKARRQRLNATAGKFVPF
jgi:predicted metal-dependent hydrolase